MKLLEKTMPEAGIAPDVASFNALMNVHVKRKDPEAAWKVLESMKAAGVAPSMVTFTALAKPYSMTGDWEKVETIQAMAVEAFSAEIVHRDTFFLNTLLITYA